MEPRIVYLDTNVYDRICKSGILLQDALFAMQSAIDEGLISIPISAHVLEEIASAIESAPHAVGPQLALVARLADRTRILCDPRTMLEQDVMRYAKGRKSLSPFTTNTQARDAVVHLLDQDCPSSKLLQIADDCRRSKEFFNRTMAQAKERNLELLETWSGDLPTFAEFWHVAAPRLAEDMAQQMGVLAECKRRGILRVLELRSVRLRIGMLASLDYAQNMEGCKPKAGDSRDTLHAVCASAADVFVTEDRHYAKLLRRIPEAGFRVLSLSEFAAELRLLTL